jgi:casein kinase 1
MIKAIREVHLKGMIHRDIKPDNFVVGAGEDTCENDNIKVIDFGISRYWKKHGQHIPYRDG